jgi:hypothetical protein
MVVLTLVGSELVTWRIDEKSWEMARSTVDRRKL